jgi:hypothetical protein
MGVRRGVTLGRVLAVLAVGLSVAVLPGASAAPASPWVPTLPTTQQSRQFLTALPDGTAYVFDVGSAITLWHSSQFGVAWDALTYLPGGISTFAQARFATDKVGYLVDFDKLYKTANGATTAAGWKPLAGPRLPKGWSRIATAIGVTDSTVALGGELEPPLHVGCNPPAGEAIWTSHDGGSSWLTAALPRSTDVGQVRYLNSRDGVALAWEMKPDGNPCEYVGNTNSVYVTHDGGRHFAKATACAAQPGELCTAAHFLDPRHLLVGRNNGTMAVSSDGGRTFREGPGLPTVLGPQPTKSANDESFWVQGFARAGQTVFATTKLAGAYVSTDDGATWTREASCDSAYSLGIGEVAAFDAQRAIAGGPTCVATRTGIGAAADSPASAEAFASVPNGAGVDFRATARGRTFSMTAGRLVRTDRSG